MIDRLIRLAADVGLIVAYVLVALAGLFLLLLVADWLRISLRRHERNLDRLRAEHYADCDRIGSFNGRVLPLERRRERGGVR